MSNTLGYDLSKEMLQSQFSWWDFSKTTIHLICKRLEVLVSATVLERAGYSFIFQEWPVDLCTGFSFGFISKLQWQVHYGFDRCPGKNYVQY